MKVKKYLAKDMTAAMNKIKEELGQDAIILNSKRVETGGFLGFFTKKNIEVIAAVDQKKQTRSFEKENRKSPTKKASPKESNSSTLNGSMQKQIDSLKKAIRNIEHVSTNEESVTPPAISKIKNILLEQEIEKTYVDELIDELLKKWYQSGGSSKADAEIVNWAEEIMLNKLNHIEFKNFNYETSYLNIVGPTGVGKTTTIAKIAAKAVLKDNKKVAFITTDTYRIAAIEQLKTYAKILHVPVEVAYTVEDFKEALQQFKEMDLVIIDSAGRNFRNSAYVEQLKEVIDFSEQMKTHLVLSAASKQKDMEKIIEQFQQLSIEKIIFSKLDETESVGSIYNISLKFGLGSSYFTTGQNVPDDIITASKEELITRVLRS